MLPSQRDTHRQGFSIMRRSFTFPVSILVCVALLNPGIATAQASRLADLEDWLGRLVGQFTVQTQGARPAQGSGECRRVGTGPVVSCLFTILESSGARAPAMPQLMLFGVDAADPAIELLQLDYGEPAISARGSLRGDTVVFTGACPNRAIDPVPTVTCDRLVRIHAAPGNQSIQISLEWTATSPSGAVGAGQADVRIELRREAR